MAAETGFTIDGVVYEIPTLASFTMDEAQILWDFCQRGIEDFVPDLDNGEFSEDRLAEVVASMKNPAFRRTLMYVAYRRKNEGASKREIDAAIGSVSNAKALADWAEALEAEGEDSPPESTLEPSESSERSSAGSSESSGTASEPDTDAQVVRLAATTDGSSPPSEFPQTTSVG